MRKLLLAVMVLALVLAGCADKTEVGEIVPETIAKHAVTNEQAVTMTVTAEITSTLPEITEAEIVSESPDETNSSIIKLDEIYLWEDAPLLGSKTAIEIIDDFLANDDLINFSQDGKSEEEIIQNLLEKNVVSFYTFFHLFMQFQYNIWERISPQESEKKPYIAEHIKFKNDFDMLYKFALSTYTKECADDLLDNDVIRFWEENEQIYIEGGYEFIPTIAFFKGFSFEIKEISESEIVFEIHCYHSYDMENIERVSIESTAVKVDGEWRLTRLLY